MNKTRHSTEPSFGPSSIILLAAWFGLVTGLVEGAGLLGFQKLGWLSWKVAEFALWYRILWSPAVVDLLLFLAFGLPLAWILRALSEERRLVVSTFLFSFLMFLDWALLSGRIQTMATPILAAGLATATVRLVKRREASALRFFHRTLPIAAAVTLLMFVGVEGGGRLYERTQMAKLPPSQPGTPNILVILVDTLRADHLSAYGYPRNTSPHIDQLARQGTLFDNAFAVSSWTLPSHASLLTGRYPHEHGAMRNTFSGGYLTISEALAEKGLRTGAFSANVFYFSRQNGFGRAFLHFEDFFHSAKDTALRTVYGRKFYQYLLRHMQNGDVPARKSAAEVNRELLNWLGNRPSRPFFAFLNYFDTHDPYLPPVEYLKRYSKLDKPAARVNELLGWNNPSLSPDQLQAEIDAYDAAVAYVDDQIRQLLEELRRRGFAENTLVVLTSDHGESLGEHGLFTHRTALYRELIWVPLVFYWPGRVPAGVRVNTPVSNIALPATLLDLIGAKPRDTFRGPSLAAFWKTPEALPEVPYPLAELSQMPFAGMRHTPAYHGAMQSLVNPEWHYIHNDKLGTELFSWEKDPKELQNLTATPEGQRIAEEFAAKLREMLAGAPNDSAIQARGTSPTLDRKP